MIAGAVAISFAEAPESEHASWRRAMQRECDRYDLDPKQIESTLRGEDPLSAQEPRRSWWEFVVIAAAVGAFVWLAAGAERQPIAINQGWMIILGAATLAFLIICGILLWKRTRFS